MKKIVGENKVEKVIEHLESKNLALFQINALTRNGREELMEIISRVFTDYSLNLEYMFNVYSAIVEVLFNAVKANVKFLLFQDEVRQKIQKKVSTEEIEQVLMVILREAPLREFMNRFVVPKILRERTQKLLKLSESRRTGSKELDPEDEELVRNFEKRLRQAGITIHFTIALANNQVVFTVVNHSPILGRDLQRIEHSRAVHKRLADEGRSSDFFSPEYLDPTESAGMGIAMADEVYYQLGLNAKEYFTIATEGDQTRTLLRFPRRELST